MKKLAFVVVILLLTYVGAYAIYRQTHIEVWEKDGKPYVIFPRDSVVAYYLFRPLTYADGAITGMGFHVGPHQAP
jgi:hypothetical protein